MTSTELNFVADKKREYEQYLIWRSLPRDIDHGLWEKLGVTDETILELSAIPNQKQLAKHLGLAQRTITDWNKKPIPEQYRELDWRYWAKKTTPTVVSALLRKIVKHGDAARVNTWMKYVEQIEDNATVNLEWNGLADLVKSANKVLEENGESTG